MNDSTSLTSHDKPLARAVSRLQKLRPTKHPWRNAPAGKMAWQHLAESDHGWHTTARFLLLVEYYLLVGVFLTKRLVTRDVVKWVQRRTKILLSQDKQSQPGSKKATGEKICRPERNLLLHKRRWNC